MNKKVFLCLLLASFVANSSFCAAMIHISPNGNDKTGNGSKARPYATLAKAVEATKKNRDKTYEIVLADGTYRFSSPVVIGPDTPISCIRAANPGKAILSGAVEINGWKKDPDDDRFLIADIPFEINASAGYCLVVNNAKASMALYPAKNKSALPYYGSNSDVELNNRTVLRYNTSKLPKKDMFKDLDLSSARLIIPQEWATTRPYIATNDWQNGIFYLKGRTDMPIGRFNQGYRVLNSIHGMTEPGKWMYEGTSGRIRYWPKKGETLDNIKASISRAPRIISAYKAKDLRISGLVLEGCSVQPGSGMYSKKGPAAVIGGWSTKRMIVEDCEIRNAAGTGILVTKPQDMQVRRCKIHGMGGSGVHYADGGKGGGIYDCEIYNIGAEGAYLELREVTLKSSHIHHVGRSAATLWTTGAQVISNEFHHTMLSSRDGGAIYGAMNNSLFEGNYCHDCGGWPGLYNDEGGKETVYRGNKFVNCWWPFHMHQTRDIVFTNNTMECDGAMRFSFQGSANAVFRNNLIRSPKEITSDKYVDHCKVWENYVETGSSKRGWSGRKLVRLEKKVMPLKSPCYAFPTKGPVFPKGGKMDSSMFATPWTVARNFDRDEKGCHAPGIPGCFLYMGYDAENLYIKANYEYNKFVYYPGCTTIGSAEWGKWDGLKFFFKNLEITVFIDGTVLSSDPTLRFDETNSSVVKRGGTGAKGYRVMLAIPLKRFGLDSMTVESLVGKTINFDALFYNAQYKETRYYEGPSKGNNLPGVIRLGAPGSKPVETKEEIVKENPPKAADSDVLTVEWGAKDRDEWEKVKRPETLKWFLENEYGIRPKSVDEAKPSFECIEKKYMDGGEILKRKIRVKYEGKYGKNFFDVTLFQPQGKENLPLMILLCNRPQVMKFPEDRVPDVPFWPVREILSRGFATAAFMLSDLSPETYNPKTAHAKGVIPCFEKPQDRTPTSWGTLSAWAWGASKFVDWVEGEKEFDTSRIGVVGHSRGGKAALIAGVLDERFSLVCSNNSGCGGAKLNRMKLPKSEYYNSFLHYKVTYWFCENMQKVFPGREHIIEHDQDEWLALIAPRKLCVASATEDFWAGPPGEYFASERAKRIWKLYGLEKRVKHHVRKGKHDLTSFDWMHYLDAMQYK